MLNTYMLIAFKSIELENFIFLNYQNLMKDLELARKTFVEAWASMASLFSFSPSTARVCGLLITCAEPLSPSEISDRLGLSRGNVSMCLKELRAWGVVRRVPRPGDRREFYESRGDLFEQTLAIARERKRREFDPVVGSALEALTVLARDAPEREAEKLGSVAEYLTALDRIGREVLENEQAATALIALIKSGFGSSRKPAGSEPPAQAKESR
jgi:DNA-binding transcriptional regulator GbsR (MarR family)